MLQSANHRSHRIDAENREIRPPASAAAKQNLPAGQSGLWDRLARG